MYQYAASAVDSKNQQQVPEEDDVLIKAFNNFGWGKKWSNLVDTMKKQVNITMSCAYYLLTLVSREMFHTTTFENNLEVMWDAHSAFKDSLSSIRKVSGIGWSLVFQPLVPSATLHHHTNAMGINTDKTLTVVHVNTPTSRSASCHRLGGSIMTGMAWAARAAQAIATAVRRVVDSESMLVKVSRCGELRRFNWRRSIRNWPEEWQMEL